MNPRLPLREVDAKALYRAVMVRRRRSLGYTAAMSLASQIDADFFIRLPPEDADKAIVAGSPPDELLVEGDLSLMASLSPERHSDVPDFRAGHAYGFARHQPTTFTHVPMEWTLTLPAKRLVVTGDLTICNFPVLKLPVTLLVQGNVTFSQLSIASFSLDYFKVEGNMNWNGVDFGCPEDMCLTVGGAFDIQHVDLREITDFFKKNFVAANERISLHHVRY